MINARQPETDIAPYPRQGYCQMLNRVCWLNMILDEVGEGRSILKTGIA